MQKRGMRGKGQTTRALAVGKLHSVVLDYLSRELRAVSEG